MREKPEEEVRQQLFRFMIDQLAYPPSLLLMEKGLNQLPHIKRNYLPNKRFDLIAMGANLHPEHPLFPLLMIECKADKITRAAKEQVLGYNYYVGAIFVGVASREGCCFLNTIEEKGQWQKGVPTYGQLCKQFFYVK